LYLQTDMGLEYWLTQIDDDSFEQLKTVWAESLRKAVHGVMAKPRLIGHAIANSGDAARLRRDESTGMGTGTALLLLAGIGAAGGLGYAWHAKKWPFANRKPNPAAKRFWLVGHPEAGEFTLHEFRRDNEFLAPEDILAIERLSVGDSVEIGGGAWATFVVARTS
jgi:hypothetical protein